MLSFLSVERVVAILTPTIFAPVAALLTKWIAVNIPGLHVNSSDITALQVSAIAGAVVLAWKWLHGRQIQMLVESELNKLPGPIRSVIESQGSSLLQSLLKNETGVVGINLPRLASLPSDEEEFADPPSAADVEDPEANVQEPTLALPDSARKPDGPGAVFDQSAQPTGVTTPTQQGG